MKTSKIGDRSLCDILSEIDVISLSHISLDEVWLHAACNAQIRAQTAEVH